MPQTEDVEVFKSTTMSKSGPWGLIGMALTFLVQAIELITFPEPWDKIAMMVGGFIGVILNIFFRGPSYRPLKGNNQGGGL